MPTVGPNVTVEGYTNGVEGSQITYYCQSGLLPRGWMMVVCTNKGQWRPDPTSLEC